jgi:hypothetical protein
MQNIVPSICCTTAEYLSKNQDCLEMIFIKSVFLGWLDDTAHAVQEPRKNIFDADHWTTSGGG